jgi:hypothetical protein
MTDLGYTAAPLSEKVEVLSSRGRLGELESYLARPCSDVTRKGLRGLISWEKNYLALHDPDSPKPIMLRIHHALIEHEYQKRGWWEAPCGLVFVLCLPLIVGLLRHGHPLIGCLLLLAGIYVTSRGSAQPATGMPTPVKRVAAT